MERISDKIIGEVAYTLLKKAATEYPKNYFEKVLNSLESENSQSGRNVIISIIHNIISAAEEQASLCQDTGIPTFHIFLNPSVFIKGDIEAALADATVRSTSEVPLRKNVIEPFSFKNSGNNTGWGAPFMHFHYSSNPGPMRIRAELKGFGAEIKCTADWLFTSTQSVENAVLAYVINNVLLSKGECCLPGFLGVGVGGYVSEAMSNAKNAVFRELNEKDPESPSNIRDNLPRHFEKRIFRCVNSLGLGPMGGGGKATTMGVYLEGRGTHTAVASVAVSQQCWASRSSEALVEGNKVRYLTPYLNREELLAKREGLLQSFSKLGKKGSVYKLSTPIDKDIVAKLRVGDVVYLNGTLCTSRDMSHKRMVAAIKEGKTDAIPQELLDNGVVYHCGPVVIKEADAWGIIAAGPTTSSRFTDDAAVLFEKGVIKVAIGKGTMGGKAKEAIKGRGDLLAAVGGCAVTYKKMICQTSVKWLDLGYPEAMWIFDVIDFGPLIVNIDSKGNSLSEKVMGEVYENARRIYREEGLDPNVRFVQYPQTFAGLSLEEVIEKCKMS